MLLGLSLFGSSYICEQTFLSPFGGFNFIKDSLNLARVPGGNFINIMEQYMHVIAVGCLCYAVLK